MEKNSMSPPRAIIFSHPRSGLHFLRCGLYLLEGGIDSYETFWASYDVFYSHNPPTSPGISSEKYVEMYETHNVKIILLLRSYHDLLPKTVYPMILNTYVNLAPEKLKLLHPEVDMEKALNKNLSDLDRFGSFGFEDDTYVNLITFFNSLPFTIDKKVVFYDDLMSNDEVLLEAADFVGIEYCRDAVNVDEIRQQTKQLYVQSGHFPSPPEGTYLNAITHLAIDNHFQNFHGQITNDIYDKYLKRFKGKYQ